MRPIKFRAWDKIDKKVRKVMSLDFYNTRQSEVTLASDGDVYLRYFEQTELMQYIGLKDINGQEVYEGDIVKCEVELFYDYTIGNVEDGTLEVVREFDDVFECIGPIKFENGGFWIHDLDEDRAYYLSSFELNNTTFEVIGNIYANKELLND